MLTFSGINLFARSKFAKVFRNLIFAGVMFRCVAGFATDIMWIIESNYSPNSFPYLVLEFLNVVCILSIRCKRSAFIKFMRLTSKFLNPSQILILKRLSIFCLVLYSIALILLEITLLCYDQPYYCCKGKYDRIMAPQNDDMMIAIVAHIAWILEDLSNWGSNFAVLSIFSYCHMMKSYAIMNLISRLESASVLQSNQIIGEIRWIQDQFDKCFSFPVLLIFAMNFVQTIFALILTNVSANAIYNTYWWLLSVTILFCFIVSSNWYRVKIDEISSQIIRQWKGYNLSNNDVISIQELQSIASRKDKGWHIFELTYASFAFHVANIISFSALFIQLTRKDQTFVSIV